MSFEDRIEGWHGSDHDGWSSGWGHDRDHDHGHRWGW